MSTRPDSPELKAAAAYTEALNRHTPLLTAFERGLRIIDEMFQRVEREMYAGLAYPATGPVSASSPGLHKKAPTKGSFNKELANAAVSLSRALSQTGAVHARLLAEESARADAMSEDEKVRFMVMALAAKPRSIREAVAAELLRTP